MVVKLLTLDLGQMPQLLPQAPMLGAPAYAFVTGPGLPAMDMGIGTLEQA